jgi:hypothetical protein
LNKAKEYIEVAIQRVPKIPETVDIIPMMKMTHANILKGLGQYKESNKLVLEALTLFGNPTNENSLHMANAYYELAEFFVGNKK